MDKLIFFLSKNPGVQAIVNIASLASLIITIIILIRVSKITRSYLFKVRAPQHIKKLKDIAQNIVRQLSDYENNKDSISRQLTSAEVQLEQLQKKSTGKDSDKIKSLRNKMKNSSILETREGIFAIYCGLIGISEALEESLEDRRWGN